jgi:hypothetical protein
LLTESGADMGDLLSLPAVVGKGSG